MNRRLVLLNVALIALLGALVWILRANWLEAQARERAVLLRKVAPKAVLAPPSPPGVPPAAPSDYIDVASKMLFSKDRNPTVVVEPPKPAPEPVMPALPSYSGQMAIGTEPVIFLNPSATVQRTYHAGDQVGEFKIVSFDQEKISFEWNGKSVERKLEELRPRQVLAQTGAGGAGAVPGPNPNMPRPSIPTPGYPRPRPGASSSAASSVEPAPEVSTAPAPAPGNPVTSLDAAKPGGSKSADDASDDGMLGPILPGGFRSCVPADTSPSGTVHSGYRKVQSMSILGASCDWEPTK